MAEYGEEQNKKDYTDNKKNTLESEWEPTNEDIDSEEIETTWEPTEEDDSKNFIIDYYDPIPINKEEEQIIKNFLEEHNNQESITKIHNKKPIREIQFKADNSFDPEALKKYLSWYFENENKALIDPPYEIYKIIKKIKAIKKKQKKNESKNKIYDSKKIENTKLEYKNEILETNFKISKQELDLIKNIPWVQKGLSFDYSGQNRDLILKLLVLYLAKEGISESLEASKVVLKDFSNSIGMGIPAIGRHLRGTVSQISKNSLKKMISCFTNKWGEDGSVPFKYVLAYGVLTYPNFEISNSFSINKLKISKKDNVAAKLIKTVLFQIYHNQDLLAEHHNITLNNKYGFKFLPKRLMFTTAQDSNLISDNNVGIFMGAVRDTIQTWKEKLNDQGFVLSEKASGKELIMFRKIRSRILKLFDGQGEKIAQGREAIKCAINNYMEEHFKNIDYITKICLTLDDCALWENKGSQEEAHSENSISKKLSSNTYLQSLRYSSENFKEFEEFSKYLKLVTNILLLEEDDFKFIDKKKYDEFRNESIKIVFEELVNKGVFTENIKEMKIQYDSLVYTLYALSCVRKYRYTFDELKKFQDPKNPNGLYTLSYLNEVIGCKRQFISNYIKYQKFIPSEKIQKIKLLLEKHRRYAPKKCNIAISKLEIIPKQRLKNRPSYVGRCAHPILENIIRKALLVNNIDSKHENLFNRPKSYHRIDSSIEISSQVQAIKKLNVQLLNYKEMFIDYTIPSKKKINKVFDKFNKNYHGKERFFTIVFYGHYANDIFSFVEKKFESFNINYKENICFMDLNGLAEYLNIDERWKQRLDYFNTLTEISLGKDKFSDWALGKLENLSDNANL